MTVGGQVCMDGADLPNNQDQNDDTKINDCNINIYFSITFLKFGSSPSHPRPIQFKSSSLSHLDHSSAPSHDVHIWKNWSVARWVGPVGHSLSLPLAKRIRSGAGSLSFICWVSPWCCAFNSLIAVEWVNCHNLVIIRTSPLERMRLQLPPFTRLKLARYRGSIRRK